MDAMTQSKTAELVPFALKGAPALIERAFPATKVSFEAQRERKAGAGQTLTALGSYWKGRKPLILVRAIVLGSLLPQTDDAEADLAIFEALMCFDIHGLARRAVKQNALKPKDLARMVSLDNPWAYFKPSVKEGVSITEVEVKLLSFPLDADELGITLQWKRGLDDDSKAVVYAEALESLTSYEARASLCKRPEEVDEEWLYAPVWRQVNAHYANLGINAHSFDELVDQLGQLRYGKRPRVGDTFSGGGSIPFEAARLGCEVYASDLNPVACMLTWGALNIIGASPEKHKELEIAQSETFEKVDKEIISLGVENDSSGNRAKAYLYCLETRCPETGWLVPMSTSWVISKTKKVIARLKPNYEFKRFDIDVESNVSQEEVKSAEKGTVQGNFLVYSLNGKQYKTSIKTIKGVFKDSDDATGSNLRSWEKNNYKPDERDIFKERLYCIYWMDSNTLDKWRPKTYFASVTEQDLERERQVDDYVNQNIDSWINDGLVPDMKIEPGYNTSQPVRERGWKYWLNLFNARGLLYLSLYHKHAKESPVATLYLAELLNYYSRLCAMKPGGAGSRSEEIWIGGVFSNQALNTFYNYGTRAFSFAPKKFPKRPFNFLGNHEVECSQAASINLNCELWITDPPYADAVNYHEITEYFIAWLRKNPPAPFDQWTWDSRRNLAIKGSDDDFRRGMVDAYKAMTDHMPDDGIQCVMFTHQDTGVWSDMVGIFWAAGLQVMGAWYIATETTSELKKGGYVQGTVILMLRKRPEGDRKGFARRIYPAVHKEVEHQIEEMMHLNQQVENHTGEPVFNDADLQMAGYAAALKVLTSFTEIGGEDVTTFALRPRQKGEKTVVDDIVQQASETANSLLVPDGLKRDTWQSINGIQRFYLRMLDIETTGASKLDNYQNFAKAFRVEDYTRVMASTVANSAKLKQVEDMTSRDLMDSTELGATHLGHLMVAIQQLLNDVDIKVVVKQLVADLPDYYEKRGELIDMALFLSLKSNNEDVRHWAEVLGDRVANEQLA